MKTLRCHDVSFTWRTGHVPTEALRRVSFSARESELVGVIGPSGCGKSTLLQLLVGLERPTGGTIEIDGVPIDGPSFEKGLIFQEPRLFPWLTVSQNVEFGPAVRGIPRRQRRASAATILGECGLSGWMDRFPHELSGGMKQRVAIARALANDSELLCMDEPFAALDFHTRLSMASFLLSVWEKVPRTIIFVTHSIDEVVLLSDRVLALSSLPGTLLADIVIDLQRPRDVTSLSFNVYRSQLMELLGSQVNLTHGTSLQSIAETRRWP